MPTTKHLRLSLEMAVFFAVLPAYLCHMDIGKRVFFLLWAGSVLCYFLLRTEHRFSLAQDWNSKAVRWPALKPLLLRFILCAAALSLLTYHYRPDLLLSFIRHRPWFWALVMVIYPILSVFPQELVYRSFFFIHFRPIFSRGRVMVIINALLFGWAHIVLFNWIAMSLAAAGSLLFAHTYRKHRSLALACFEHSLYGCFIFTLGLGRYFY